MLWFEFVYIVLFVEDVCAGIIFLGNQRTQVYKSQFGRNAASFRENWNFSTSKFSQALEVWVKTHNFSKISANMYNQ